MSDSFLKIEKLRKYFPISKGLIFRRTIGYVKAVDGIDLEINQGQTFALVGESGCGKSTTGLLILKLLDPTSGSIWFKGTNIAKLHGRQLNDYRESVQAMFKTLLVR